MFTYIGEHISNSEISLIGLIGSLLMIVLFLVIETWHLYKDKKVNLAIFYCIIVLITFVLVGIIVKDNLLI